MPVCLPAQDQPVEVCSIKADGPVLCVAFSGDGKTLAYGGGRLLDRVGTIGLSDVATGKEMAVLKNQRGRVLSVVLSSDGNWLTSGDEDGFKTWDLKNGACTGYLKIKT